MPTIEDVYRVDTRADTGGLETATQAVREYGNAVETTGQRAGTAARGLGQLISKIGGAGGVVGGAALWLRNLGHASQEMKAQAAAGFAAFGAAAAGGIRLAARAMAVLKGALLGVGLLIGGGLMLMPRLFQSIRGAMDGTAKAAGGVGRNLDEAAQSAADATQKVQGVFGAWGDVGAGYVMAAGKQTEEVANDAVDSAEAASEAIGEATERTSRFGALLDKIGARWAYLKNIFLSALGKALVPLLERVLVLLEDPATEKFVTLLAEDFAQGLEKVVGWLIDKVIPAFEDWMDQVNAAGGLVNWLKETVTNRIRETVGVWSDNWQQAQAIVSTVWSRVIATVDAGILRIRGFLTTLGDAVKAPWRGLAEFVKMAWTGVKKAVVDNINAVINAVNVVIIKYNANARKWGLPALDLLEAVSLAQGGLVNSPTLAVVGDHPRSPEVVAPLENLLPLLRQALAGSATVQIAVTVAPGGFATPEEAGQRAAAALVREARARGMRW